MKALLLKDLLILRRNGRHTLLFLVAYCVIFGLISQDAGMVGGISVMMLATLSIGTFSYDNLAHWDSYALCLPVTRKQMVQAKYLLALLSTVAGGLLAAFLGLAIALIYRQPLPTVGELLSIAGGLLGASVLLLSILLPLIYRFGVEKSRLIIIAVVGLPTLLIYLLVKLQLPMPSVQAIEKMLWVLPVLLLALLAGSYLISCRIFSRKEF